MDGIPVDIYDEVRIDTMKDYHKFLPDTLPARFTTKDYAKCAHIPKICYHRSECSTGDQNCSQSRQNGKCVSL